MMALTYVRTRTAQGPGEEFDLDNAMWSIPSERMKMRRPSSGSPVTAGGGRS